MDLKNVDFKKAFSFEQQTLVRGRASIAILKMIGIVLMALGVISGITLWRLAGVNLGPSLVIGLGLIIFGYGLWRAGRKSIPRGE